MSDEETKAKRSKRLHKTENAIHKQQDIAIQHVGNDLAAAKKIRDEPHRFAKHHAMDCGDPECAACGNPRKVFGEKTIQEKRLEQGKLYEEDIC